MIVTSAIVAFAVLVVMFYLEKNELGVRLCVSNLCMRLIEAMRVAQLHYRVLKNNDYQKSLLDSATNEKE